MALILLALFLHAALAGATHFHRLSRGSSPSAHGVAVSQNEEANAPSESAGHTQCLLCRLQRNLASNLSNAGPATTEPLPATLRFDAVLLGARHRILPGLTQGRAPPLA